MSRLSQLRTFIRDIAYIVTSSFTTNFHRQVGDIKVFIISDNRLIAGITQGVAPIVFEERKEAYEYFHDQAIDNAVIFANDTGNADIISLEKFESYLAEYQTCLIYNGRLWEKPSIYSRVNGCVYRQILNPHIDIKLTNYFGEELVQQLNDNLMDLFEVSRHPQIDGSIEYAIQTHLNLIQPKGLIKMIMDYI